MRERELNAEERRQERVKHFAVLKVCIDEFLSAPGNKRNLEIALRYPLLGEDQQAAAFDELVEKSAELCLTGEPEFHITPEIQCHLLIEFVDHLAHARPALERAVELYRDCGQAMPQNLKRWAENPGIPPPRRRGPRQAAQDWKALRDQIIGDAVDWAAQLPEDPLWSVRLPIKHPGSSEAWRKGHSICRAVVEVIEERYGNEHYQCPTYQMVCKAWERYRDETGPKGKRRPGRPLLPPKGLDSLVRPPGIDTEAMLQKVFEASQDYVRRMNQRDQNYD